MKKTSYFKVALILVTFITTVLLTTSCSNNQKTESTKVVAEQHNDADFNEAYADMMVSRQIDAIEAFEEAPTDSYDADVKNWATATLSDLRTSLEYSIDCQKKCDKIVIQNK